MCVCVLCVCVCVFVCIVCLCVLCVCVCVLCGVVYTLTSFFLVGCLLPRAFGSWMSQNFYSDVEYPHLILIVDGKHWVRCWLLVLFIDALSIARHTILGQFWNFIQLSWKTRQRDAVESKCRWSLRFWGQLKLSKRLRICHENEWNDSRRSVKFNSPRQSYICCVHFKINVCSTTRAEN